jgi:hypothetical protein
MLKSDYYKFVTEAFRYVFSKIPPDYDSPLLRRSIAEAMSSAETSNATVADVENAGLAALNRILFPTRR